MSLGLPQEDIEIINNLELSADEIGAEKVNELFDAMFQGPESHSLSVADDREIDSAGNSKSPARDQQQQHNQYLGEDDAQMTAEELEETMKLLEDDDDDGQQQQQYDTSIIDQLEAAEANNAKKKNKKNRQVEDAVDDVVAAEDGGDVFDWDKISENEEKEREMEDFDDEDDEFKNWIRAGADVGGDAFDEDDAEQEDGRAGRVPETLATARAALVKASMTKMGVTQDDEKIVKDPWPERLKELELAEGRPRLRGSTLPDGSTVEIARDAEALWILKMLVQPGYPLERRANVIQDVLQSPDWRSHPLVQSIQYALDCFIEEQLEPAYLMIYRSSKFSPLVIELLRSDSASRDAHQAWFGYCANTGRRQQIQVQNRDAITELKTLRGSSIGACYEGFKEFDAPGQPVIRRPGFIPLGRLLTEILFFDSLCNRLERHRHITLDNLTQMNDAAQQHHQSIGFQWFAPTQNDIEHLSRISFDSPHSSDVWSEYSEFFHRLQLANNFRVSQQDNGNAAHTNNNNMEWARSPSCRLILLDLAPHLQDYALPGPHLHENVITGTALHISGNRRAQRSPLEWAGDIISTSSNNNLRGLSQESLLRLLNDALVEQLTVLPFVREAAMSVFISEGRCEIAPSSRSADQQLRVTTVQNLLQRDPALFLDLLEEEAGGSCIINFTVDIAAIERALPVADLLQGCGVPVTNVNLGSQALVDWQRQLLRVREPAARRLQHILRSHVRVLLHEAATRAVSKKCIANLGHLLAEGPYEPSTVRVNREPRPDITGTKVATNQPSPFKYPSQDPAVAALWPVAFEIAESLPVNGVSSSRSAQSQRHRVCGCVRSDIGVTVFAFIDSFGMLKHVVRWVDTAAQSEAGREIQRGQQENLLRACRTFEPEVIAVAPSGDMRQTWRLFREVNDCISQDNDVGSQTSGAAVLRATIPVVFSSPVIAKLLAASSAIVEEFPRSDQALRDTVALARHTQDPLRAIAALFDNSENGGLVGRLPIGCEMFREEVLPRMSLYKKLEWEMVLWVAASGVDATALLAVPTLFAERQLQFVPGLGRRKAARLMQVLRAMPGRLTSRREISIILCKEFGGGRLPRDVWKASADPSLDLVRRINPTVVNAACVLRIRPNEAHERFHDGKSENLYALYYQNQQANEDEEDHLDQDEFDDDDANNNNNNNKRKKKNKKNNSNTNNLVDQLLDDILQDDDRKDMQAALAHHLLDETNIPPEWYQVTLHICKRVLELAPTGEHAVAILRTAPLRARHGLVISSGLTGTANSALASQCRSVVEHATTLTDEVRKANFFGRNEIEYILDELISFGAVRSRRNYRKMTDARFFALVTGQTFVESRKKISNDRKNQSSVLCLGDIVEGQAELITISNRNDSNQMNIKLKGSRGLTLSVSVDELPSELANPIRETVKEAQRENIARGRARNLNSCPVPFGMRNMTLYGRLVSVDLATGDARISYEATPVATLTSLDSSNTLSSANINQQRLLGIDSSRSRESGEVNSIRSIQLTVPSKGNALRASSHILYKNVSNETAKKLLENSQIGEALIRPCNQPKSGDVIVVVKAGDDRESITNIPVFEERRATGAVYYRLVDPLAAGVSKSLEFNDLDHLLERYVRPMARRYRELTQHRRFHATRQNARDDFDDTLNTNPNSFVYSIIETPEHARCTYSVLYRMGASQRKEKELKLVASGGQLLVQNPKDLTSWIRCENSEMMTNKIKAILCHK